MYLTHYTQYLTGWYNVWYTNTHNKERKIRMSEKEEFRPIEGFPEYEVSNLGNVRSYMKYPEGRLLSVYYNKKVKYNYISLRAPDGKYHNLRLNRVVAKAFIPNPDNLPVVDHINDNSRDDRAVNLQWMTQGENNLKGGRSKRAGKTLQKNQIKKGFTTKVTAYREGKYLYFDSVSECARFLKLNVSSVINLVNKNPTNLGSRKSLGGYQIVKQGEEGKIDKEYHPHPHIRRKLIGVKDSNSIKFDSLREAERKTGVNRKSISRSLKENAKLRSGWNFEYLDE